MSDADPTPYLIHALTESDQYEAVGILDDMVDRYEANDDPADWPEWAMRGYDFLRRIGKR